MTYGRFLLLFLVLPIAGLLWHQRRRLTGARWAMLTALAGVAVTYTTPWDNYLVAHRVWWYDPGRVWGITLGWVPLEEYLFFVLQPFLTGLWALAVSREPSQEKANARLRLAGASAALFLAALGAGLLLSGRSAVRYLGLELAWALPPLALQLAFGADLLWANRQRVAAVVLPPTLYLAAGDALAIQAGVWTIDPGQSLGLLLGGRLPIEELLFFLLTNLLLGFSVILLEAPESARRARRWQAWFAARPTSLRRAGPRR